jgi:hypothetical protein
MKTLTKFLTGACVLASSVAANAEIAVGGTVAPLLTMTEA